MKAKDVAGAYRADALFDAHRDDPEFGHRLLANEARAAGTAMSDRTAWRICRDNSWWSERTYHRRRRQASLGRLTPVEYETIMNTPAVPAA